MTNHADDSLLQCLLALCRYHGSASTPEAIVGGLPLDNGKLTPGLFERAASRVSLASRVLEKPAREIEPALLPAVLLMEDKRACLLMGWSDDGQLARVVYPDLNESMVETPADELLTKYTGSAIVCRPRFRFDARAPRTRRPSARRTVSSGD